ncbi:MAG: hypothetical protein Q9197_004882 [Variospora fuerteventurae]
MTEHEDTSYNANTLKDPTNSLTPEQPQLSSESVWTLIEPDLTLHPTVTTSLSHHPAVLEQANLTSTSKSSSPTSPTTTQLEVPSQQSSKLKRSRSSVPSSQAQTAPSADLGPTTSQIALRKELDRQDLELREIARTRAAEEESDSGSDNISISCSDSDNLQFDMTSGPEYVRKELENDFMFIDRGHLKEDHDFRKIVTKVMETDRKSTVSEEDIKRFKQTYEIYKDFNEATLVHALLPFMMTEQFTAQNVDAEGHGEGDFKERSFVDEGVVYTVDHLFQSRYCLPHRNMNVPGFNSPEALKSLFDSKPHLTTPKPDFVYGLRKDKLPSQPPDIMRSDAIDQLLNIAPIREVFFVWENKSGGGNLIKCGNDALKDTSALVYARRQIYEFLSRPSSPGIDKDTYIYAAINDNKRIEFYVAYAWLPNDLSCVEFCMDRIGSEDFTINELTDNRTILPCLRKPLHNIIEWGSVTRIPKLIDFYDQLWRVGRELSDKAIKEAKKTEAETSMSKKKQKTSH